MAPMPTPVSDLIFPPFPSAHAAPTVSPSPKPASCKANFGPRSSPAAHAVFAAPASTTPERLPSFSAVVVDEVGEVKGSSEPVADDKEGLQEHSAEAVLDLEGSWAIYEPEDKFLSPTISRRGPKLSPIPSTNPSTDDLVHQTSPSTLSAPAPLYPTSPTQARTPSLARKSLETLPPSPFPRTPSPEYSSPPTSPKSRLHVPSGTEIMRLGAGVIKGMAQFGGI
ncbi:hypothetical protein OF83DRAFT_1291914 [Amylostereum chailletii]|nr:hypothetical protein OF83DRAFT_1291914 [Amylostereum chailletii]